MQNALAAVIVYQSPIKAVRHASQLQKNDPSRQNARRTMNGARNTEANQEAPNTKNASAQSHSGMSSAREESGIPRCIMLLGPASTIAQ